MYYSKTEIIRKVVAYARYSSNHQNPISINIQLEAIRKYCEEKNYELVQEFADEAQSGGGTKKRVNYQAMFDGIENRTIDCDAVIVYRCDRAGRDVHNLKTLEAMLQSKRKRFISVTEPTSDTTAGQLHRNIQYAVSEYERGIIGDRSFDGLKRNAEKALHCGGTPPLGYTLDEEKKLVIEAKEAEAVKLIFNMYDQGNGYGKIASRLNELAYLTKKKLKFKKNSIHDILINEKYTGVYTYNKAFPKNPNGGNNSRLHKDEEDIIRVPNAHPAIITEEMFERVQIQLQKKSRKPRESKTNYIFRGIIQCQACAAIMTGDVSHDSKDKNKIRSYYRCPNKKVKACATQPVNRYVLEDVVLGLLHHLLFQEADLEQIAQVVNHQIQNDKQIISSIERYKQALQEQSKQEARLFNSLKFADREETRKKVMREIEELQQEQQEMRQQIARLEQARQVTYGVEDVKRAIEGLNEYVKTHKNEVTRGYLQSYVKNILVDNDTVEIIFNEENECA